jgi:hypothetical protein
MSVLLLSAHILVAIVFVGSATVAASLFPRYARRAVAELPVSGADVAVAAMLHRITRVYALASLAVPVLGIATALRLGVLGETWVMVSTTLTAVAGAILALAVMPGQRRVLATLERLDAAVGSLPRLAMVTGIFNLLWVAVVVLMVLRPGSTTLVHP